jgi:hypothetical protein
MYINCDTKRDHDPHLHSAPNTISLPILASKTVRLDYFFCKFNSNEIFYLKLCC